MNEAPYPDKIIVEVDSEVESIVPEFLENRRKDCLTIGSLLERFAFSEVRTLGHRMKGAGGSYGFDDISVLGEIIEEAAMGGDTAAIMKAVQRLSAYLDRVVVEYV
jgi:hypothetical protein